MPHTDPLGLIPDTPGLLSLGAQQQPLISLGQQQEQPEVPSKFRDFALNLGARPGSLLFALSGAFGQGTEEIAARKRRDLETRLFEREAQARLTAKPQRQILEAVGGEQRFVDTGERVFPESQAPAPKPSSIQERINLMIGQGVSRKAATGIATGQLSISRDPITNEAQVIDKATGARVEEPAAAVEAAATVEAPVEALPQVQPDVTEALGASGFAKGAVNRIVDFFGGGLPFEQTSEVAAQLDNLNLSTLTLASSGIDGRPNRFFQEKVNELLVQPESLFSGRESSLNRFDALATAFSNEASRIQNDIDTQSLRPNTVDQARQRISELNSLSQQYRTLTASQQPEDLPALESFFR